MHAAIRNEQMATPLIPEQSALETLERSLKKKEKGGGGKERYDIRT